MTDIKFTPKKGSELFIKDIDNYFPKHKTTPQLLDDWRIVLAWYSIFREGKKMKVTSEQIENLALVIMKELTKRGVQFHPSEYKKHALELYVKTLNRLRKQAWSNPSFFEDWPDDPQDYLPPFFYSQEFKKNGLAPVNPSGVIRGRTITLDEVLQYFKPFYTKHWVDLVGGVVENGRTDGDIDILIHEDGPNLPLEFRIGRQFPPELAKRIQFLYDNEHFGPFTSYVRLFNQKADAVKHKVEEMEDEFSELLEIEEFAIQKPFSHPAGQRLQSVRIVGMMPEHKKFVEPFAGSATVFWSKKPTEGTEVLNDKSPIFSRALSTIKNLSDSECEKISKMNWTLSNSTFFNLKKQFSQSMGKLAWLHAFVYLARFSYGGLRMRTKGPGEVGKTSRLWTNVSAIKKLRDRMKNTKITKKDYLQCLRDEDSPDTFFYIDPPYYAEKDKRAYHMNIGQINFDDLINACKKLKGKFIMSIGDEGPLLKKMKAAGFKVKKITSRQGLAPSEHAEMMNWPLVSNYELKTLHMYSEDYEIEDWEFECECLDCGFVFESENHCEDSKCPKCGSEKVRRANRPGVGKEISGSDPLPSQRPPYEEDVIERKTTQEIVDEIKMLAIESDARAKGVVEAVEPKGGSVTPLKFITQLKGIVGYRKNEVYNIPGLLEVIARTKDFYPAEVDEKYDGMRVQLHRKGKDVKIWSEDGGDVTSRFPSFVKEMKSLPVDAIVLDAEVTGWTEGFRKGKHMGRSDVSGYAHKKSPPHDKFYYANVFDIMYIEAPTYESKIKMDLHETPLNQRRADLEGVFKLAEKRRTPLEHVRLIEVRNVNNSKELIEAIKFFSRQPGSEGAMIKSLRSIYPLSGKTSLWIKYKNEVDMDVEVIDIHKVKGSNSYNYLTIIRDQQGRPVPAGRTYNTLIKAKLGDIIRVAFVNLNKYTDPKTGRVWYNMWSPRPIELREDKKVPDSTFTAERIVNDTRGEKEDKPFPTRYSSLLKNFEEYQDPFLNYPDPNRKNRFVLQAHIRGKSVHLDDRRQFSNDFAVGMTHAVPKGLSKQPESLAEAKRLFFKEVHPTVLEILRNPQKKFLSFRKALVPIEWLDVEGWVEKGEPGATKNEPGYFIILDKGEIEFGALQPDYHEYFYHGDIMKGKYNDRQIENPKNYVKVGNDVLSWMFFHATNPPYVITKRAVDKKWIPPKGQSALPKSLETKVPESLQYWKPESKSQRLEIRNELVKKIKSKEVAFQKSGKFSLSRQDVIREKVVVRVGPSRTLYHLSIELPGEKGLRHFRLEQNPTENDELSARFEPLRSKDLLTFQGTVPARSKFNTFPTPAEFTLLDREKPVEIMEWNKKFMKVLFKGKELRGIFTFTQEDPGSKQYTMERQMSSPPARTDESEDKESCMFSNFTEFSIDHVEAFEGNPHYLEISGTLFHRGKFRGMKYTDEHLKQTRLIPRPGENLVYVNFFHNKNKSYRTGILSDIWFDERQKFACPLDGSKQLGALKYRAVVTDSTAINEILQKRIKGVSAEVNFNSLPKDGDDPHAINIDIIGMAITSAPALKNADIGSACHTLPNGKVVCS